jgi:PTH1 family peptidyl-tRNA hydrolase
MIKLIVGLGNPGRQYEKTRHNAGFLFLDYLVSEFGGVWGKESRFEGFLAEVQIDNGKVILLKPDTFMNRSGQAVGKVVRYYKLSPENVLVIHDELDFDVGVAKLKKGGGHAGHNGLKDIIAHLGSSEFYRLRIGIGRPSNGKDVANFVLSESSKDECLSMRAVFEFARCCLKQMIKGDMAAAMNKLNSIKNDN